MERGEREVSVSTLEESKSVGSQTAIRSVVEIGINVGDDSIGIVKEKGAEKYGGKASALDASACVPPSGAGNADTQEHWRRWYFRTTMFKRWPTFLRVRSRYGFSAQASITLIPSRVRNRTGEVKAMSSALEFMNKPGSTPGANAARVSHTERRSSRRCKINQLMRIRPSDPERDPFEDIRGSLSVSRNGVFFQSSEAGYEVGMRLFVSMPYSKEPAAMTHEYLAEVVRREPLPNGLFGVGFKILMEMGLQGGYSVGYHQRK